MKEKTEKGVEEELGILRKERIILESWRIISKGRGNIFQPLKGLQRSPEKRELKGSNWETKKKREVKEEVECLRVKLRKCEKEMKNMKREMEHLIKNEDE